MRGDNTFAEGIEPWLARFGNLRNVVRQEMVTRQIMAHLPVDRPLHVLDVGAGQGTQSLRLAALGHIVTAAEPEPRMREAFEYAAGLLPPDVRSRVDLLATDLAGLMHVTRPAAYDIVLCHGVLMYLPDSTSAIATLAGRAAPGGLVSLVGRNADALAWRPACRHDWATAAAMLDETEAARRERRDPRYRNEIGVDARADTLTSLSIDCGRAGLDIEAWYGIRVSTDAVPLDEPVPGADELAAMLDVEERLGRTDPYRGMGNLLHLLARRRTPEDGPGSRVTATAR
ncbi:MAG: methyltransferase domain-containing protein [Micrococcales bacterium]|nr:methyltransferase domain-containing protein [Micrococcales bacterium]